MAILMKWRKKGRAQKDDFSSKVLSSSRSMARPNRREAIDGEKPLIGIDIAVWSVLLGVSGYLLFFSPFLSVDKVEISGLDNVSDAAVRDTVSEALSGKRLFIWPKDNFFAVRPGDLARSLSERYPLFREVSVTRRFPDGLSVEAQERGRIVLWHTGGSDSLMLAEDGSLVRSSRASDEENAPYLVSITDLSSQPADEGDRVADERMVPFVSSIGAAIDERFGMSVRNEYAVASRFAGELRMTTSEGWELFVSTELPVATTLDTLALLFERELPREKRDALRYVDLRIENRVYYAFRNAPEQSAQSPEASDEKKPADDEKKKKK